jgi:hypothetical protein
VSVYELELQVKVKAGEIIVTVPSSGFMAVYYKRAGHPFLTLRQRTETDDYELLAQVFRAAANKARELGWIALQRRYSVSAKPNLFHSDFIKHFEF